MNRNLFRACTLIGAVGVLGVLASCGENPTGAGSPVPLAPTAKPALGLIENLNGPDGACLAKDAFLSGEVSGVNDSLDLANPAQNCTANDVKVASADIISFSFNGTDFTTYTGQAIQCIEGDPIFLELKANLEETATSTRTDIGVWIATDGGNARTGTCNQYNLRNAQTGVSNTDSDSCGDLENQGKATVPLGVISTICQAQSDTSSLLHIGSCLGWTEPGGDQACPQGGNVNDNGFRWGTVPGTTSKCNCSGFNVPIVVEKRAKLEVKKVCDPTTDNGTFDLLIDGSNSFADNVACGGSTGAQELSAGTNVAPGAVHTFGEGDFTTANYTSSYACVNRGTAVSRGSGTSLGPNNITLQPNDDVVCTYTNVRNASIVIVKDAVPNDAQDFAFTSDITGNTSFSLDDDADPTLSNTKTITNVAPGSYTVTEGSTSGWDLTNISCVDPTTNSSGVTSTGVATINVAAGETVTCTYTNTKQGSITIIKDAVPNDAQDFAFTSTITGNTSFSLDDDADPTLSNTKTIAVAPGTYTVTEGSTSGWDLTDITCVDPTTNSSGVKATGVATINLAAGESVTCTYTNTKRPKLTLVKRVVNDNGGTKTVSDFTLGTNAGSLTFDGGAADGTNITKYTSNQLTVVPGTYTLTEANVTGYDEGTWSCTGVAGTVVPTYNAGSVVLAAGEVAVCTITNNDQPATLKIIKTVKGAGGSFPFTTTGSGLSSFTLSPADNASDNKEFTGLSAGSYSVTETDPAPNYVLTDLGCDNQPVGTYDPAVTKTVNVSLTNGQTVTCTFINEKLTTGNTTRTQGFWATHSSLTNKAWFGGSIGGNTFSGVSDKTLCAGPAKDLNTLGRVLGGFWSNIAQKYPSGKRTSIDQARMQLVQQLLAAILNNSVFGSVPSGSISIQQAKDAYCGSSIDAIKAAASAMAAFNESGDNGVFTPGVSANGKLAKSLADLAYWNTLP